MGVGDQQSIWDEWKSWMDLAENLDRVLNVKPGPLLRTSHGNVPLHMPITSATQGADVVKYWKAAELEIMGVNTLNIVPHSGRHTATARARVSILYTYCPEIHVNELIDGHMNWEPDEGRMRKEYTGHLELKIRLCVTMKM